MSEKNFTSDFEQKIIQAVLTDSYFAEQISEVLEPDYFDSESAKEIVALLVSHYQKYNSFPSISILKEMCFQEIEVPILKSRCVQYLERMQSNPLNGDGEYVKDKSLMFFRTQSVKNALLNEVIPKIEKENLDEIVPIIEKALSKGSNRSIGMEYKTDEKRFEKEVYQTIPTPWPYLNTLLGGGWQGKRLTTFIAPPGAGKSMFLCAAGVGALMEGKTVVHYCLELDEIEQGKRYDAAITGIKINDITEQKTKVLYELSRILPEFATLIIKEYPMKSASIQTIKAHLGRLRLKEIVPDLIIIDYGDLLKTSETFDQKRDSLEMIWQEMKRMAQEMIIPVLTAAQINRLGYNAEVITLDKISEDFSRIMTSDVVISMARNLEQKAAGAGKMLLGKNRQGHDGQIMSYEIDTSRCYIAIKELTADLDEELKTEAQKINPSLAASKIIKKGNSQNLG
jgi:replicative DNA helicase